MIYKNQSNTTTDLIQDRFFMVELLFSINAKTQRCISILIYRPKLGKIARSNQKY